MHFLTGSRLFPKTNYQNFNTSNLDEEFSLKEIKQKICIVLCELKKE